MASLFPIVGKNLPLDSLGTKKVLHTLPTQPACQKQLNTAFIIINNYCKENKQK
jgi:hypothetical protein